MPGPIENFAAWLEENFGDFANVYRASGSESRNREFFKNLARQLGEEILGPGWGARFERQIKLESDNYAADVISGERASSAGAQGIAQFMPETAASLGVDPLNPTAALRAAAEHMLDLLEVYDGDIDKALAAYNAGQPRVDDAVKRGGTQWSTFLPEETQTYLEKIVGSTRGAVVPEIKVQEIVEELYPGAKATLSTGDYRALSLAVAKAMADPSVAGEDGVPDPAKLRTYLGLGEAEDEDAPSVEEAAEDTIASVLEWVKQPDGTYFTRNGIIDPEQEAIARKLEETITLQEIEWNRDRNTRFDREQNRLEAADAADVEYKKGLLEEQKAGRLQGAQEFAVTAAQNARENAELLGYNYDALAETARANGVQEAQLAKQLEQQASQFREQMAFEQRQAEFDFELQRESILGQQEQDAAEFVAGIYREPSDALSRLFAQRGQDFSGGRLTQADIVNDVRSRLDSSRGRLDSIGSRLTGQTPTAPDQPALPLEELLSQIANTGTNFANNPPAAQPPPAAGPAAVAPSRLSPAQAAVGAAQPLIASNPNLDLGALIRAIQGTQPEVPGLAAGGMTTSRLMMVGEEGPELMMNPTGAPQAVVNNPDTMRLMMEKMSPERLAGGTLDLNRFSQAPRANRGATGGRLGGFGSGYEDFLRNATGYGINEAVEPGRFGDLQEGQPVETGSQQGLYSYLLSLGHDQGAARQAAGLPPANITQEYITEQSRLATPPAFESLLRGDKPSRFRTPVPTLPTAQGISQLTPDELEASRPRLAAEFNITLEDLLQDISNRFGRPSTTGRSRLFVR